MTSLTRNIWGREFTLPVHFEDLDNDGINDTQWDAFGRIVSGWKTVENSLPKLKDYCIESDSQSIGHELINIFMYVIPKSLFIADDDEHRVVALMCDYRFDPEHGIAIVFEDENLKAIGSQDIIL